MEVTLDSLSLAKATMTITTPNAVADAISKLDGADRGEFCISHICFRHAACAIFLPWQISTYLCVSGQLPS